VSPGHRVGLPSALACSFLLVNRNSVLFSRFAGTAISLNFSAAQIACCSESKGHSAICSARKQSLHYGPITLADEHTQWTAWKSKLATKGVRVGPRATWPIRNFFFITGSLPNFAPEKEAPRHLASGAIDDPSIRKSAYSQKTRSVLCHTL
jgi:hypothetical protein